jgi:hypothetical protein
MVSVHEGEGDILRGVNESNLYRYTVHFGICGVHSPTNALFILKNTLTYRHRASSV